MDFREDTFMLILGISVIVFIIAQSVAFLVRACRQGKKIGMSSKVMRNTMIQSVLFTITPALAIVATVIALAPSLGIILPWIRLSVIGNITQETAAAASAIEASMAEGSINVAVTDKHAFSIIMWVMTLASSLPLVVIPLCLRRIQGGINKAMSKTGDSKLTDSLAAGAFIGLIAAFIAKAVAGIGTGTQAQDGTVTYNYDGAGFLSVATLVTAVVIMLILTKIADKLKLGWLSNFAMPISMFAAMGVAVLLSQLLPESLVHFEFRAPVIS